MALWRDPLDELIEDLERALPETTGPTLQESLPRLEDLQAVISPILFGTEEERKRNLTDPEYQRLSDTVMRQLAGICDDRPSEPAAPGDSHVGPAARRAVNGQKPTAGGPPPGFRICICGADRDAEHTPDCPLADANMW